MPGSLPSQSGAANSSGQVTGSQNADVTGEYRSIRVNLKAEIDISGNVEIFTTADTTVDNVVVCSVPLSAGALYDSETGLGVFEFTEPSATRADIAGAVSGPGSVKEGFSDIASYGLPSGLQSCLTGTLNAEDANPFNKYKGTNEYTNYASLGGLVLSLYASYLFGHPAATAGITNDDNLVSHINGGGASEAQVGTKLANAIVALSDATATEIVKAVVSQDPRRMTNAPNREYSAVTGQTHMSLLFRAGDVVYVSISVKAPAITASGAGALVGIADNAVSRYPADAPKFAFEITLA